MGDPDWPLMRIVVAHNRYVSTSPSGENAVVDDEVLGLRESGHDVLPFFRNSDDIARMRLGQRAALAGSPIYSRHSARDLAQVLRDRQPDVLHLHNPYPLISPWVVRVAADHGVPVVQTVHNYRHGCVAGTFFRDGHVCEDCLQHRLPWPAVQHACYRNSRAQSVPMAVAQVAHRPTWLLVSRFLVLTEFMGRKLVQTGVPASKLTVRPTAIADPGEPPPPGRGLLFIGRLSDEKGVALLLAAWRLAGIGDQHELTLAGDGPLLESCTQQAASTPGLRVLGRVDKDTVNQLLAGCAAVVVPSECYEGFPRVVVEAFAHGRPVLATDVGSLAEVVTPSVGWTCEPTAEALALAIVAALNQASDSRGHEARRQYLERYRPERVLQQLTEVYHQVAGG